LRIVKELFLEEAARTYPKAAAYLEKWRKVVRSAAWKNLIDVRSTYPSADGVRVSSGREVTIFNVCGNDFRLVVAIHYDRQIVFTLRFLTHAEYSKNRWRETL
jgi:mRNA interferase HigB